jgi:hypothetical protein
MVIAMVKTIRSDTAIALRGPNRTDCNRRTTSEQQIPLEGEETNNNRLENIMMRIVVAAVCFFFLCTPTKQYVHGVIQFIQRPTKELKTGNENIIVRVMMMARSFEFCIFYDLLR